ncbi:MAG: hypothetical protein SPF08_09905, partial [Candidatus Flemingibacterium sp.]|nr:hypothetical protein [Candidatus Flemingibacterium sp.]
LQAPPLVIGMGPAGLFAAYLLAKNGYRPLIVDRGEPVDKRVASVERFRTDGVLDPESNIQFGAGGAGTFSDGKLVTRIHDPRCRFVLETLHAFGAPDGILTLAKPHIGTDILRVVVNRMLSEIERLGGSVRYRTRVTDLRETTDGCVAAKTVDGEILCGAAVLAIGHSARDTYRTLIDRGYAIEAKPISVGVRAEHLQQDIDRALYGSFAGHPDLGHAEYALSDTRRERGVYTFCMCPGGEVVAAASEEGGVVTNGMSRYARDGRNGNSAIAVSVLPEDIGKDWKKAIEFQRMIERSAFRAGGNDYSAPVETLGDFLSGKTSRFTEPSRVVPTYMNGKYRLCDIGGIFPGFVTDMLKKGFRRFGGMIKGFDMPEAVLTGAETRTSSPVRIPRNDGFTTSKVGNLYPCGEGAGYAGGITSAAVDGIRTAIMVIGNN